jgi:RNA polymerase sigma-70 factor (ECF subfamily)
VNNRAIQKPRPSSDPKTEATGAAPDDIAPELLARLQRGDIEALGELFEEFGDRVYNTCRRITGRDCDAEDATQEVFLRVLQKAPQFDGHSRFSTWLFRLAVNHTINLQRKTRRSSQRSLDDLHEQALPTDQLPLPLETVAHREERRWLDEALQNLPTDQRTILILREIEGLSYGEIGAVLGLPAGTVTSRLVRGRERLAEMLRRRLPAADSP